MMANVSVGVGAECLFGWMVGYRLAVAKGCLARCN